MQEHNADSRRLLTREDILGAQDIVTERIPVPEWGGDVIVRSLTARQIEILQDRIKGKGLRGATALLASAAIVDENGKPVFNSRIQSEVDALGRKSMAGLQRVMNAILKMNALDPEEVEALAKNSANGQDDDSLFD